MLPAKRQNHILKRSQAEGSVRTTGLAEEFGVTEETIRRDLDKLAQSGLIERIHGGAMAREFARREVAHSDREARQQAEKESIARRALEWIEAGETILLDGSSTALDLARLLPEGIRVLTYSEPVMEVLRGRKGVGLISLGGTWEEDGRRFGGILTERNLQTFRIDRFFFSGKGYHESRGASEADESQARLKMAALEVAEWSCLLVDHTKLGATSNFFFAGNRVISTIVTDAAGREYFQGSPKVAVEFGSK